MVKIYNQAMMSREKTPPKPEEANKFTFAYCSSPFEEQNETIFDAGFSDNSSESMSPMAKQTPFHAAVSTESTDKRCSPFGQDKNPSQPLVFPFGFSSSPASSSNCSDLPAGLCGFMNSPPLIEKTQSSTQQPCLTADFGNIHDESLELINSKCNNVNICYLQIRTFGILASDFALRYLICSRKYNTLIQI